MLRALIIVLLFLHALIHVAIWMTPSRTATNAPFDAAQSWLIGTQPALSAGIALLAAALLAGAGVGLLMTLDWWRTLAIGGAAVSLALVAIFFNPWFLIAAVVDAGGIVSLVWIGWPGKELVGA